MDATRTAVLVVMSKTRMMRSSWVVVAVLEARHILAANSRQATMMQFNLSHVGSEGRAGAVAKVEARAGAARVVILFGGHATKSNAKVTDWVEKKAVKRSTLFK